MATTLPGLGISLAQVVVGSILVKPTRKFGPFVAQVTMREVHDDELTITDQPTEQGAVMSDHAFKNPANLVIEMGWSNSPSNTGLITGALQGLAATVSGVQALFNGNSENQVREVYDKLLKLQNSRVPFMVYTGKRVYSDMLIKRLTTTTGKETENSLLVTAELKQILIVNTRTVSVPAAASKQKDPGVTQPSVNNGQQNLIPSTSYVPRN